MFPKSMTCLLLMYMYVVNALPLDMEVPIHGTAHLNGSKLKEYIDERVEEDIKEFLSVKPTDDEDEESGSGQECQSGWERFGDSCYLFSTSEESWGDAKSLCESHDAHLAVTETTSEIEFLKKEAEEIDETFWLGGSDQVTEGEWIWASTGQRFTVTYWHPAGEPNNQKGNENCLDIHDELNYGWNDEDCSLSERYICKKRKYFGCRYGWIEFGGYCYFFSTSEEDWSGAMSQCQQSGANLAEVYSNTEIRFLKDQARTEGHKFWLGGTDQKREGNWIWGQTGNKFTVTDWADSSEPNNAGGNEDCLGIKDFLDFEWNDENCDNEHRYICEREVEVTDEEPVH